MQVAQKTIIVVSCAIVFGAALYVYAANPFDIQFPISELGNCGSLEECKVYCDEFSHANECNVFAVKYGLSSEKSAEKVKNISKTGPGGCTSESECKAYCDDISNADE